MAPTDNSIDIIVYTQSDLQANPTLNSCVVDVINKAFQKHASFRSKPRFEHASELPTQLGTDGLCAVARLQDRLLGSASLCTWRPTAGGVVDEAFRERTADLELADAGLSYEAKAIGTVDEPLARGKGIAGIMMQALLEQVQARHPGEDLLLWIQLSEEHNGAYWRRRGYEQVGPVEIKPKGTWGSPKPFEFCTMVKRIPGA
jgi:GNAT superfamily N-acetyltransferase